MAKKKKRPTADAVAMRRRRYYKGRPDRLAGLEKARADDPAARKIVELRTRAGKGRAHGCARGAEIDATLRKLAGKGQLRKVFR